MRPSVMASKFPRTLSRKLLVSAVFAALVGVGAAMPPPAAAQQKPTKLSATYAVTFAGIQLGRVHISSRLKDGRYALKGSGRLQFLGGLVWDLRGNSSSSGALTAAGPRPADFAFTFDNSRKRSGALSMTFRQGAVTKVRTDLPKSDDKHPRYVPVTEAHLDGVLDPFSALFMAAASSRGDHDPGVCDRRLPVFDGKHRFDLQLSHKRSVRVNNKGKGGYEGPAVVCRVQYVPVSGYKRSEDGPRFMERNQGIEVWMIPVPGAGMHIPYHVEVPTPYGPATATSASVDVELDSRKKIVLID